MSTALPDWPGPADATPFYLDWGGVLRSPLGGADQKLNRIGDRFGIEIVLPPLRSYEDGMTWVARLIAAQKSGALIAWPQLGFDPGDPGAPRVNGGGQAGMTLNIDGLVPGYALKVGQALSVIHGGRRYLHLISGAGAAADGDGRAAVVIAPMMRAGYADNAIVEIAEPMIEGFLDGNRREWNVNIARTIGLRFAITEAE